MKAGHERLRDTRDGRAWPVRTNCLSIYGDSHEECDRGGRAICEPGMQEIPGAKIRADDKKKKRKTEKKIVTRYYVVTVAEYRRDDIDLTLSLRCLCILIYEHSNIYTSKAEYSSRSLDIFFWDIF